MQRFASSYYRFWIAPVLFLAITLGLTSCGGDGDKGGGGGTTKKLAISLAGSSSAVSSVSVNFGDVIGVDAILVDSDGKAINELPNNVTWTSDAPTMAGVTSNGLVCGASSTSRSCICGGEWKNNNVDCAAPSGDGTATITAKSGDLTATAKVFVHTRVSRVEITTPTGTDCVSSKDTFQLTAKALDANGNPVQVGTDGTAFSWFTGNTNIVTTDSKGLLTAVNPGRTNVYAYVSNVTSPPATFTTCGLKSIKAHVKDSTDTSFTVEKNTTKTLVADVIDTKDKTITITNSGLLWSSSNNGAVVVDQSGGVSTPAAGTSAIVVSCAPPTCNTGLNYSVFSNPVIANVNGSSTTTVVVASPESTSLYPIDTTNGTVGTAVTLPYKPNSLIYARTGLGAYLGSDTTLMTYDGTSNSASAISISGSGEKIPGKVIAVSDNGGSSVVFDNTTGTITVVVLTNTSNGTSISAQDKFTVSGIPNPCNDQCPRASFTPDSKTAYIVAGSNLYVSSANASLKTLPLAASGKDVAVLGQGSFAFVAQEDSNLTAWATCNNSQLGANTVSLSSVPQHVASTIDATKIYAITPPQLSIVTPTTDAAGCPPNLADPLSSVDLGQGTFNTKQMVVSSNGSRVAFLTDGTDVVLYDSATNSGTAVTLNGGATVLSGEMTLDGANLFVGGSDKKVHRIDLTNMSDAQQITVSISPDLVAVKPK